MKKFIAYLMIVILFTFNATCFGAWDKTLPLDNALINTIAGIMRANWAAIELGTDAALQITNAKVSPTAGIVDTKLAQITTPAKVSGAAITLLTSLPSGAGVIPAANLPGTIKVDSSDTTYDVLGDAMSTESFQVNASDDIEIIDEGIKTEHLEGGSATPSNSTSYGINASGTPGFYATFPTGGIILWSGSIASIPSGWAICNGSNGTPNLQDRFIVGAGSTYAVAATGGATTHVHAGGSHTHTVSGSTTIGGDCFPGTRTASANGGVQLSDGKLAPQTFSVTSGASGTADTGSGSSLPPYYALAYIMKL